MVKTKKVTSPHKGKKKSRTKKTQKGGNPNTDLMNAIEEANLSYIETNIGNITDLSFENSSGNTPLDVAITKYNELKTTDFMGDDVREMELYSIRTQIIIALLKNGANGENIELPGINFNNVELKHVNLSGSDLTGATLEYANLDGANLTGATLENANLDHADLTDANLSGADLQDTIITNANLKNTKFIGANMNSTSINGSDTTGADFTGTILDTTPTSDTVFRTTTDLPRTFDEQVATINTDVNYNNREVMSDIEGDSSENNDISLTDNDYLDLSEPGPLVPPTPAPRATNDSFSLLGLMDSTAATQPTNENDRWSRTGVIHQNYTGYK